MSMFAKAYQHIKSYFHITFVDSTEEIRSYLISPQEFHRKEWRV